MKVKALLDASQTGATKFTVKGSDLSSDIKDYVVKRGTVVVTMSDTVTVNAAKDEAVLTAAASIMPAGDYTLTYKENDPIEMKVETSKINAIEIQGDTLALTGDLGVDTATVNYKVLNQFNENITSKTANVSANTSFGTAKVDTSKGIITVSGLTKAILNTSGTMVVIETTSGVNTSKTLTLGQQARAAEFDILGVYNSATKQPMTLKENADATNAVLLVNVQDQYGNVLSNLNGTSDASFSFSSGITNVKVSGTVTDNFKDTVEIDGKTYVTIPLTKDDSTKPIKAGTITVFFVSKTNGHSATKSITVAPTTVVKTIDVYPLDSVYDKEDNEFGFIAMSEDGTEIKDYATLNSEYGVPNMPIGFTWVKKSDGTAKLNYNSTAANLTIPSALGYTTTSASFITAGYGNKNIQFNVYEGAKPTSIGGTKDVILGTLNNGSPASINLKTSNVVIYDQYGRKVDFTDAKYSAYWNYGIKFTPVTAETTKIQTATDAAATIVSGSGVEVPNSWTLKSGTGLVISTTSGAITDVAKQQYRLSLIYMDGTTEKEISGSDFTITVATAPMSKVVSCEMDELGMMYVTKKSEYYVAPNVVGKTSDGTKIQLPDTSLTITGDLTVVSPNAIGQVITASDAAAKIDTANGKTEGTAKVLVTVNDASGTTFEKTVTVSNVDAHAKTFGYMKTTEISTAAAISDVRDAYADVKDQYGVTDTLDSEDIVTIKISDIDSAKGTVDKNNTKNCTLTGTWAKDDLFTVTITLVTGSVWTTTFKVK